MSNRGLSLGWFWLMIGLLLATGLYFASRVETRRGTASREARS